jgi:preprotein translocase subunit SecD
MTRRLWLSLVATTLIVVGFFAGSLATRNTPQLGLDLQGGASVILEPAAAATGEDLSVVRDLIRDELERTGIGEPNVRVQGQTIVVELPGVKDRQAALEAVDVSGIVELRPVINSFECQSTSQFQEPLPVDGVSVDAPPVTLGLEVPDAAPVTVDGPVPFRRNRSAPPDSTGETVITEPAPTSATPAGTDAVDESGPVDSDPAASVPVESAPVTVVGEPSIEDVPLNPSLPLTPGAELLATREGQPLCLGPAQGTGEVFERQSATVTSDLGFGVAVDLRDGQGSATWNALADQCFNGATTCPRTNPSTNGQIAIVLDGVIQSAPSVNQTNFSGSVSITGSFTQSEADDLARILNRGAFPVEMVAQDSENISPAAGRESLRAGVIAGIVGVILVLAFMIAYYRWLALVIFGGLIIWGMAIFTIASFVSSATNYSLSLAGVTGIIVSVGVTVDSYVVFFERMKDEIRNGRTLRNAAPRSFTVTWRTIWSADLVSVIGAAILFWLSVGSVRGFALFLGITTVCDLFVCYFFTRPAVLLLARSKYMVGKRAFGLEVTQ